MVSLKKQKGFTLVELLIVIIIIGILATLVIVTFTGVQQKARDSKRQTDLGAVDSHVEAFYAQYAFYPTLKDMQSTAFLSSYMKGLDPGALVDPKGGTLLATDSASNYGYTATDASTGLCSNTTLTTITGGVPQDNGCTAFSVSAKLEATGQDYIKKSNT